jgi:catechol 2,3-dioxygenase-like lactoylglutathione lyase family enzyme
MVIRGVRHTAISTPDLDRAAAFWAELGFVEVRRWQWPSGTAVVDGFLGVQDSAARAALLEGHGTGIELFEFASPAQPAVGDGPPAVHRHGFTHLCVEVDDVEAEMDRLGRVGMTFWNPPVTDPSGRCMVYGRDPDGNVVELVESVPPAQ